MLHKKIPCYVLVFDQVEIIQKSLAFLTKQSKKLDLIIIENPSPNTPKIKKIVDSLGQTGLVKRYYIFNENITGNAFGAVLNNELGLVRQSRHIVVTDGDIVCQNDSWLSEEKAILKRHRDVFACGVSLDLVNLPLETFSSAKDWIPADMDIFDDFYEAYTGAHLLLFRGKELASFLDWRSKNKLNFVDGELHKYCYGELHKKWARTKTSKAYHLTWDLYADKKHPYTVMKTSKVFQDTWYHNRDAPYRLTNY
jgi:hypothetical protein